MMLASTTRKLKFWITAPPVIPACTGRPASTAAASPLGIMMDVIVASRQLTVRGRVIREITSRSRYTSPMPATAISSSDCSIRMERPR